MIALWTVLLCVALATPAAALDHIAFTNRPSGTDHIYKMNADGTNVTQLTNNGTDQGPMAWSFDGSKITWANNNDIYVANADGSGQVRLTTAGHYQFPSFSQDGRTIYLADIVPLSSPSAAYLATVPTAGGSVTDFLGNGTALLVDPHVSPDGTRLAFESNIYTTPGGPFEIYTCTLSNCSGTAAKLTHLNDSGIVGQIADPNWKPDGSQLVVSYCPTCATAPLSAQPVNVAIINSTTGAVIQQLTSFACPQEANDAAFDATGNHITFEWDSGVAGGCVDANNNAATSHVYTMKADGTSQTDTGQTCSNIGCGPRYQPPPITFIAGSAATTSTIAIPASTQVGDWMLLVLSRKNGDTTTGPTGWTKLPTLYGYSGTPPVAGGQIADIYQRFAQTSDLGGTATCSETGSTLAGCGIIVFRGTTSRSYGMDAFDMQGNSATNNGQGTGTSMASQTLSTIDKGDMVLTAFLPENGGGTGTFTAPGDETQIFSQTSAPKIWAGYKTASTGVFQDPGYISGETASQSVSDTWASLSIALRPLAAVGRTDTYGGDSNTQCPNGPAAHFYLQKILTRWTFCDPLGNAYWMAGVTSMANNVTSGYASPNAARTACLASNSCKGKYNTGPASASGATWNNNWWLAQVARMRQQGLTWTAFGAAGQLVPTSVDTSWVSYTQDESIPWKVPFAGNNLTSQYVEKGQFGVTPVKDAINGIYGPGANFYIGPSDLPDVYDPTFTGSVDTILAANSFPNSMLGYGASFAPHSDYLVMGVTDESDQISWGKFDGTKFGSIDSTISGAYNSLNSSSHSTWTILVSDPIQPLVSPNNQHTGFYQGTYTSAEFYLKKAMANYFATEYVCTNANTPLTCCTGVGTGTCSVDPNAGAGTAITGTNMTNAKNALNTAWGASYTTLSTSDSTNCSSNLDSCLSNGTYTGFADKSQTVTCSGGSCTGTLTTPKSQTIAVLNGTTLIGHDNGTNFTSDGGLSGAGTINYSTGAVTIPVSGAEGSVTVWYRTSNTATGTGLLDEDGNHAWVATPTNSITLSGQTTAMKNDFDGFLKTMVHQYMVVVNGEWKKYLPGILLGSEIGSWGGPPRKAALQQLGTEVSNGNLSIVGQIIPYICEGDNLTTNCILPAWQKSTTYAANAFIYPVSNNTGVNVFKVTLGGGGSSGSSQPNWESSCATTCTDGALTWTNQGTLQSWQSRLDQWAQYYGDNPMWAENYAIGSQDGTMGVSVNSDTFALTTGAQQGQSWRTGINLLVTSRGTSTGSSPFVGIDNIYWYDNTAAINGFITPGDSQYDGRCSIQGFMYDPLGYVCGGEPGNYGDWWDGMQGALQAVYPTEYPKNGAAHGAM